MTVDWESILSRDGPAVWRTAWRVLGNRADADECFQETFVAALEYAAAREVGNWRALLQRIATSRAIDRLRRRAGQQRREVPLGQDDEQPSRSLLPEKLLEDADLSATLRRALARLPAEQAEAFCLFHVEGWSYREIAEQFAISTDVVGMWLYRSKQRLREMLAPVKPRTCEEVSRG